MHKGKDTQVDEHESKDILGNIKKFAGMNRFLKNMVSIMVGLTEDK